MFVYAARAVIGSAYLSFMIPSSIALISGGKVSLELDPAKHNWQTYGAQDVSSKTYKGPSYLWRH